MNLAQLRTQLQDLGYGTDTVTQQNDFLNAAYREIHSQMRWPFLETVAMNADTTVAGTPNYTPSITNWRNFDALRIAQPNIQNFTAIEYKSAQDLFDMLWVEGISSQVETATPRYWTMYGNQIWFFPCPDDAYSISYFYITEPADMASDSDIPVLPVPYHDVIVSGAICRMAFRQRDWIGLELWTQKYADGLTKMKEEYLVRQRQTSSEVKQSGWWNTQINYPLTATGF